MIDNVLTAYFATGFLIVIMGTYNDAVKQSLREGGPLPAYAAAMLVVVFWGSAFPYVHGASERTDLRNPDEASEECENMKLEEFKTRDLIEAIDEYIAASSEQRAAVVTGFGDEGFTHFTHGDAKRRAGNAAIEVEKCLAAAFDAHLVKRGLLQAPTGADEATPKARDLD